MTNALQTESTADLDADIAALDAHTESIQALHQAAWRGPVVTDYQVGDVVWMWDHYNTAVIERAGTEPGTWRIATQDADGTIDRYTYPAGQLRPALAPTVFVWASVLAASSN